MPDMTTPPQPSYTMLAGVGGIGTGVFFQLEGDHTLGRNESRLGHMLDARDYCKLHIIAHYVAVMTGAAAGAAPFGVVPVGKVGNDPPGQALRAQMAEAGMDVRFVDVVDEAPTMMSVCLQYPDASGCNVTTSRSATSQLTADDVERVGPLLAECGRRAIVLAAPEAPLSPRHRLLQLGGVGGALRVAGFASAEIPEAQRRGMLAMVDLLAINEDEAAAIANSPPAAWPAHQFLDELSRQLMRENDRMQIVVSFGKHGAAAWSRGAWEHRNAMNVDVAATGGAGDALLAGILVGMVRGLPLIEPDRQRRAMTNRPLGDALDVGVLLAGLAVTSPHTIHPAASPEALFDLAAGQGITMTPKVASVLGRGCSSGADGL